MGVHGLWKLVEPSGKIVPLDTLENKVLAVDVSIWLHQALKGFQDAHGNAVRNAHLLGLFHRICKLLFYKIKPVFVFDGGIPHLKKQTMAARRQQKSKAEQKSEEAREKLLKNIIKHKALRKVLGIGQHTADVDVGAAQSQQTVDMFHLPPMNEQTLDETLRDEQQEDEDEDDACEEVLHGQHYKDLHSINVNSADFKALPANVRHDILSELKETRKQSSWGRLHEIPKDSGDFSSYQMTRLLKRRSVQVSLEEAEKEMGGRTLSLGELEELLCDQGVVLTPDIGKRIASDNVTRYLYVKESQESESKRSSQIDSNSEVSELESSPEKPGTSKVVTQLECSETPVVKELNSHTSCDTEIVISQDDVISSEEDQDDIAVSSSEPLLQVARDFMLENSSLTQEQILSVIKHQNIPVKPAEAVPETDSFISKSESVIDKSKVDFENLGVTQKEILAMIQAELVRCKEILEADSKGHIVDETSAAGVGEVTGINEPEMLKPGSPGLSPVVESSTNVNTMEDSVTKTAGERSSSDKQSSPCIEGKLIHGDMVVETVIPNVDTKTISDDDSDDDFVEVSEQQICQDTKVQENAYKPDSSVELLLSNTEAAVGDDLFADVFSNADTKKLDEIVGKLNKSSQVTSKNLSETCVNSAGTERTVTLSKVAPENCFQNNFQGKSAEKQPDLNVISLGEEIQENHSKVAVSMETTVINIPDSENENAYQEVVSTDKPAEKLNLQELQTLQVNLEKEQTSLLAERGKQERLAASITDQMYLEAQELLQLFGIPYIVAPMEAEAQCAFLDIMSLTDGTITDDSDIWLFGGQRVYKNFFNHKKQVLQFQASDIFHYFKLNRQQLILLALLVGSDYTVGLQGVGPVTALEILGVFPSKQLDQDSQDLLQGLKMFRDWLRSGIGMGPVKAALRSKLKNVHIHEGFPSMSVVDAYLHPQVDESKEAFSWGTPDLLSLQNYARQKFSWTSKKADEILLPVLKRLSESKSQKSIDSYFKVETVLQAADGKMSKRVQQAVQRIGGETANDCKEPEHKKPRKTRTPQTQLKKPNTQIIGSLQHDSDDLNLPGTSCSNASPSKEFIPQREQDKVNSLKNKMKAIEVFRKSKYGLDRTKRDRRAKRQILKEAYLSESSSESS